MSKARKKKSDSLGMSYSTAIYKLKKKIIFSLLRKLNEASCFRCFKEIESEDDLTIDHKVAWRGSNPDLFWNLDNVSFSHSSCNNKFNAQKQQTHCLHGHLFDEWNTYTDKIGHRRCKTCITSRGRIGNRLDCSV